MSRLQKMDSSILLVARDRENSAEYQALSKKIFFSILFILLKT